MYGYPTRIYEIARVASKQTKTNCVSFFLDRCTRLRGRFDCHMPVILSQAEHYSCCWLIQYMEQRNYSCTRHYWCKCLARLSDHWILWPSRLKWTNETAGVAGHSFTDRNLLAYMCCCISKLKQLIKQNAFGCRSTNANENRNLRNFSFDDDPNEFMAILAQKIRIPIRMILLWRHLYPSEGDSPQRLYL